MDGERGFLSSLESAGDFGRPSGDFVFWLALPRVALRFTLGYSRWLPTGAGFVATHPRRKNKDAPRVGHPAKGAP
jgi:hypothetical protein